ncbi:DUF1624 domain-containing protein [soil metagenome]
MTDTIANRPQHDAPLASPIAGNGVTRSGAQRLDAIDMLRGLVICIMVLDHVRDYWHHSGQTDPLDLATTNPWLFLTRLITHFCAPTFVFLAGVSAYLQYERGKTGWDLSRFLLTRGLWLILLELTVVNVAWQFWGYSIVFLQVIWAIGVSMVVLAGACRLPVKVVLALGVAIIVGHNALDGITPETFGPFAPVWMFLHQAGATPVGGIPVLFAYPVLPWIGVMMFGFGFGRVFSLPEARRRRVLTVVGLSMIAAFLILRGLQIYGDPGTWQVQDALWKTVGDFVDVQKYPPSLDYVLMTLGPVFVLIPWLERVRGPVAAFLLPFGRAPLFAYVPHIYIAHALALVCAVAMGFPMSALVNPFFAPNDATRAWGLPLLGVYGVWLLVLALLYLPVRWFAGVKARRRDWWLGYL